MIRNVTLALFSLLYIVSSNAQPTHLITDAEKQFKEALTLFNNNQFGLAYPLFKSLKSEFPSNTKTDHTYLNDDIDFYYAICELKLMFEVGATDATAFMQHANNQPRKHQMGFHLGHYYFLKNEFAAAIDCFVQTKFDNLSNDQIADLKFELAYAYFNQKQFEAAKPLFDEIHQVKTNKYFIAANYYFGFIAYYNKSYPDALTAFRLVEREPAYNPVVPYYVAEILYSLGRKEDALIYGDSVLSENGGAYYKSNLELLSAQLYFEKKQFKEALPLFANYVNASDKVSKEVIYELSFCYYKTKNPTKAIEGFKQLSNEKDSMGQNSMYLLGELYLNVNDKPNARTAFQFCANNSSNPEQQRISRLNYAKLSYDLGYQDIALAEIKTYLKLYANTSDKSNADNPLGHITEAKEIMIGVLANTNNYDEGLDLYNSVLQTNPAIQKMYARLLYGKAIQLLNEQRLTEADELFSKTLNINTASNMSPYVRFWKAEIAYRQQRYDDAIRSLNVFIESKSAPMGEVTLMNARYNLGYCYFQKGDYKNALLCFEPIANSIKTGSSSMDKDAVIRTADCYYMLKDFARANATYDVVINSKFPQTDFALYQKAMIAGVKNNMEKIRLMIELVKRYPGTSLALESQLEIATAFIAEEKYADAIPYLNAISQNANAESMRPKTYLKLGLAYYNNNENAKSLVAFKTLLKSYPQSTEAEEAISVIKDVYVEEGKPEDYIDLMKENGIQLAVNEADSITYTAALLKYEAGDMVAAEKSFNNYLSKNPNGAYKLDAHFYVGMCQQKNKDYAKAIVSYQQVFAAGLSKYYENATLELARMYYFELKDYSNARKYFEALQVNTSNPENQLEALRGLVRCYYQQQEYTTANTAAKALLNLKGISTDDKAVASLVSGKSLQLAKDSAAAKDAFKLAADLNKSIWGAQARYELAETYFNENNVKQAEKYAMQVIQQTGAYELWVTKSYILLGDIFMKQKDYFNAKATYQSVAENASDAAIKAEAKQKWDNAILIEKQNSKIRN